MTPEELVALLKVLAGLEMAVQHHAADAAAVRAENADLRAENADLRAEVARLTPAPSDDVERPPNPSR